MSSQDSHPPPSQPTTAPPSSDPAVEPTSSSPAAKVADEPPTNPRLLALQTKHATLTSTLLDLQTQRATLASRTTLPSGLPIPPQDSEDETLKLALKSANAVIKEHIQLLHRYNEIKDIGQGLMGLIAEKRGCRIKDVMEEFGVDEKD